MTDPATKHLFAPGCRVTLAIVQPNNRDLPVLRTHETTITELFDWSRKLVWAVEHGDDETLLNTGDHCRWCPAKLTCPKLTADAQRAVVEWVDPYNMTPEVIGDALARAETLEIQIKALRTYAHTRLEHSAAVEGWKLVAKRGTRKWLDEDDVVTWAKKSRVRMTDLYDKKLKSPTQLSKLTEVPDELITKASAGTTLARSDDKREAVASSYQLAGLAEQIKKLTLR